MINQDRVREMTRLSILESGVGERELKSAHIGGVIM